MQHGAKNKINLSQRPYENEILIDLYTKWKTNFEGILFNPSYVAWNICNTRDYIHWNLDKNVHKLVFEEKNRTQENYPVYVTFYDIFQKTSTDKIIFIVNTKYQFF